MTNCGAPNCTNRSDADNGRNKTYHKLPAESRGEIRKKWLVNIKRQNVPQHLYICQGRSEGTSSVTFEVLIIKSEKNFINLLIFNCFTSNINLFIHNCFTSNINFFNSSYKWTGLGYRFWGTR